MEGPMLIDWERVHLDGMKGFEVAIRRLEAEVCAQAADLTELRGALRPGQRMEVVWFQRYAALMLALLDVGLPEDLDAGEVGDWVRARLDLGRRSGGSAGRANGDGGRIALATGWKSEVIADLGGGWKIEAVEVPEGENASRIYFNRFREVAA